MTSFFSYDRLKTTCNCFENTPPKVKSKGFRCYCFKGKKMNPGKISNWIKKQVSLAAAKGVVLGLSGGIDSAVVALLAKKAVGKNLLCLIMPCNSLKQDIRDAKALARKFRISTKYVNLEPIYKKLIRTLPKADKKTQGNLKARLRMMVLYYYANKLNYLVAGTGNKSELMVGYFTKYGDAGVDILPIADIFKTQVRQIATQLGVLKIIIDKAPSAGLWRGQTDEKEIGISYSDLDSILSGMDNKRKQKIDFKAKKVKDLIYSSEHKRQGPKIFYLAR